MSIEKVVIEFVGDDGNIRRVLGNIKKDVQSTTDSAKKNVSGLGDEIQSALSLTPLSGFSRVLSGLPALTNPFVIALAGVGVAAKAAFDLSFAGEQLKAAEAQFDNFANQFGLNGESLRASLEGAAGGLVDVDNLLKESTGAVINLGEQAARLPEILTLARQATFALGGNIEERFTGIVNAIEAGNARALRQQGIFLDSKQVFTQYAQQLGVTEASLSKAQQQQALLNAALEQGNKKFSSANESLTPLATNSQKLSVAFGELFDKLAIATKESAVGSFFKNASDALTSFVQKAAGTEFGNTVSEKRRELASLSEEFKSLEAEATKAGKNVFNENLIAGLSQRRSEISNQISILKIEIDELSRGGKFGVGGRDGKSAPPLLGKTPDQIAAELKLSSDQFIAFDQLRIQSTNARIANEEKALILIQDIGLREEEQKRLQNERLDLLETEKALAQLAAAEKFKGNAQLLADSLLLIEQDFQARKDAITNAAAIQEAQTQAQRAKELKAIFVNGLSSTIQNTVQVLQAGGNAFEAFGKGVVGIFGDLAINVGNALLAQGLAVESFIQSINTLLPGSGAAAAAAGIGLILFGSALKASVGAGGSSGPSGSISGGSAITDIPANTLPDIANETNERRAYTGIVVNIQGDVLDSEESGLRIVSLLNDAFDKKGVVIRSGAVA